MILVQSSLDRTAPMALPALRGHVRSETARADPIKVWLLHSDPVLSAGLSSALAGFPDLEVRQSLDGHVTAGEVVIADYVNAQALVGPGGRELPRCLAVIVAGTDREWEIRRALALGARGYLVGFSPVELIACVQAVYRGEKYLSQLAAARLAESQWCDPLTIREEEVLRLVVKGLANKQIAAHLGIAVDTVKAHLRSVFEKLRVQSRTQAMAAATARGMLDPSMA